ncbi:protein BIG GRAIN 1-like C [Vicia villosa]|uniref:protein BIG GRAIN 1-like C n=1 Tax=Vicia villosa TaxID=3911 RepID=UPI00273A7DB6|nr:protein BIG GRAIN 1-like C [Vicia villosa]
MHSREKSLFPQRRRTPSFSSILLDTIDHSIDEVENQQQPCLYKNGIEKQRMNLRQAVMIEDWMEKNYTSTSSSECSSGGIFSSSETDSSYNKQRSKHQKHMNLIHHINSEKQQQQQNKKNKKEKKMKQQGWEDGFTRTKLRALKIYGELNQKVKQPISPGSKIATFLSSIFSSHNVKKAKMCYVGAVEDVSFDQKSKSPCFSSSVSSFSRRSCMSKTHSKSNNGVKRTVRFYPVSVILGEDSEQQQQQPSTTVRKSTRNSVKEVKKIDNVVVRGKEKGGDKSGFDFRRFCDNGEDDDEDEDDNDAVSYSSSDLFELDHLIGDGRFQEELPVYETTNLETNKAIANGLCL